MTKALVATAWLEEHLEDVTVSSMSAWIDPARPVVRLRLD